MLSDGMNEYETKIDNTSYLDGYNKSRLYQYCHLYLVIKLCITCNRVRLYGIPHEYTLCIQSYIFYFCAYN